VFIFNSHLHNTGSPFSLPAQAQMIPLIPTPTYLLALERFHGIDLADKDGPFQKLGFDLTLLYTEYEADQSIIPGIRTQLLQSLLPHLPLGTDNSQPYILIDAVADKNAEELMADMSRLGLQGGETFGAVVSGWMPVEQLEDLAELASLRFAEPAITVTHSGSVTSQGDAALRTNAVRPQVGVTGNGVIVGTLSDSYDCLQGADSDIATNDLPPNIVVLEEETFCLSGSDEGRAMMQLVADVAPGTKQTFHTAFNGRASFANGILELADAGATVIVDDVLYLTEPMFQDGIIAQAVDQVVAQGVAYFSSAGNYGRNAYESAFHSAFVEVSSLKGSALPHDEVLPVTAGVLHDFDPGESVDILQQVRIPVGSTASFILNWSQPYASVAGGAGAESDLDMLLLNIANPSLIAYSINQNIGGNPVELLQFTNPGPDTTFQLAILHSMGPMPSLMKYVHIGTTVNEYVTNSGTIYGHANASGAEAVGAAFYHETPEFGTSPPKLEPFSSVGATPIHFDLKDSPKKEIRSKPNIIAPDGTNTTFFGRDILDPGNAGSGGTADNQSGQSGGGQCTGPCAEFRS